MKKKRTPELKVSAVLPAPPVEQDDFKLDDTFQVALDELNPKFLILVEKIAYLVAQEGLSIQEACLIRNVDYDWFKAHMDRTAIIGTIIQKKEIEYKRKLLKPILHAAEQGDDKLAQWLLITRFPDEFNPRKGAPSGSGNGDTSDMMAAAISYIQESGDSTVLASRKSAKAILVRTMGKNDSANPEQVIKKINDLLA